MNTLEEWAEMLGNPIHVAIVSMTVRVGGNNKHKIQRKYAQPNTGHYLIFTLNYTYFHLKFSQIL